MESEIKPCPFDGSPAVLEQTNGAEIYGCRFWVKCTSCKAKGEVVEGAGSYGYNPQWDKRDSPEAKQMAIDWWNRRI